MSGATLNDNNSMYSSYFITRAMNKILIVDASASDGRIMAGLFSYQIFSFSSLLHALADRGMSYGLYEFRLHLYSGSYEAGNLHYKATFPHAFNRQQAPLVIVKDSADDPDGPAVH